MPRALPQTHSVHRPPQPKPLNPSRRPRTPPTPTSSDSSPKLLARAMTPGEWCPLRRRAPKAPSRDEHHSDETGVKGGGASSKGGGEETATKGGGLPGGRRPSETRVMARRLRREDVRDSELTRLESPRSPGQLTISAGGTTNKRSGGQSRISKGGGHLGAGAGGQGEITTTKFDN